MRELTLTRNKSTDQGTLGRLTCAGLSLFSLELPWRSNMRQRSCIPADRYICKPYRSPKFKDVYLLQDVPGRSAILIHAGNFAGDIDHNFRTNSQGCILLGQSAGTAQGQLAVLNSQAAMRVLRDFIGRNDFILTILEASHDS